MKSEINTQNFILPHLFPNSSSSPAVAQGDRGLVKFMVIVPTAAQGEGSSPASMWDPMNFSSLSPSHRQQLSMNCSNACHSSIEYSQDSLLQHASPREWQVLSGNLVQPGLLSPWVCRSCQEPPSIWASHRIAVSSQASTCSSIAFLPWLQVDLCIPTVIMSCRRTACYQNLAMQTQYIIFPWIM